MDSEEDPIPLEGILPESPTFSDELIGQCRSDNNFLPILFEWYKYVASLCAILASMLQSSPAVKVIPNLQYAILTGLLNRCARLTNVRLSSTGKYGEAALLLDRCICESAVTVQWLCVKDDTNCFQQYMADGLKSDLKLKDHIEQSIAQYSGQMLVIEEAMLSSINRCVEATGLTEEEIKKMKPLPNMVSRCSDVGLSERFYIGTQRMGSHEVHGSWTSLWTHYLRLNPDGTYVLRYHDVSPHENQFMGISLIILETLQKYLAYIIPNDDDREPMASILATTLKSISELIGEIASSDFELIDQIPDP